MSTLVPLPIFVDYFSPFAPMYDSIMVDDSCQSIVGNDTTKCSVGKNNILSKTRDASVTKSSNVPTMNSGCSVHKSVTWLDFVISVDSDGSIVYERMSPVVGTAEGSVGVSKSKIPV